MKDLEIWKIAHDMSKGRGLLVSSHGNIKDCNWVDRKIYDNGAGYKNVSVYFKGEGTKKQYLHRLVADLFVGKPTGDKTQVNHRDGDKSNNHYKNLEWASPKENIAHMHQKGFNKKRRELKNTVKLSDDIIMDAYFDVKTGKLGVREAADKYGMPRTTLSSIMNKRSRRDVTDLVDKDIGIG